MKDILLHRVCIVVVESGGYVGTASSRDGTIIDQRAFDMYGDAEAWQRSMFPRLIADLAKIEERGAS